MDEHRQQMVDKIKAYYNDPQGIYLSTHDGKAQLYELVKAQQQSSKDYCEKITETCLCLNVFEDIECRRLCMTMLSRPEIHRDTRVETLHVLAQLHHTEWTEVDNLLRDVDGLLRYSSDDDDTANILKEKNENLRRKTAEYRRQYPTSISYAEIDRLVNTYSHMAQPRSMDFGLVGHLIRLSHHTNEAEQRPGYVYDDPYECTKKRKTFC